MHKVYKELMPQENNIKTLVNFIAIKYSKKIYKLPSVIFFIGLTMYIYIYISTEHHSKRLDVENFKAFEI